MARTTTMTVRINGPLSDFVAANVGEDGEYENVSEYIRDLIRRGQERSAEIEAIRSALIEGEASGEPRRFDATAFNQRIQASHG